MTSRYPEEVGVIGNSTPLSPGARTLAQWLAEHGFRTADVVSNYVLRRTRGMDAGFQSYDATFPQREAVRPVPERIGPETTQAALLTAERLAASPGPALLWVHYQDPHGPYVPPDAQRARFLKEAAAAADPPELPVSADQSGNGAIPRYQYADGHRGPAYYRAGYRGEVAYVDQAVGALLDGFATRGLFERTIVVFAADHGEELGEGGYYFTHGENLSECLLRVPLLVRVPGRAAARREDTASLLDVLPTLAGVPGLPAPEGVRGRDLFAAGGAGGSSAIYLSSLQATPVRVGVLARDHRLVVGRDSRAALFALGSEGPDLAGARVDLLAQMRSDLAAAQRSLRRVDAVERALGPDEEAAFKALGYVNGQ
jgi:arylsulfatase A-like enzyme